MSDPIPHDAQHLLKFGAEVGLASYAVNNACKRQRPESIPGQVANLAGGYVIVSALWHFLVIPYLAITGAIFGAPVIIALMLSRNSPNTWGIGIVVFIICFILWVRYAIYKLLWRGFLRPVEGFLAAKPAKPAQGTVRARAHVTCRQELAKPRVAIKEPVINGQVTEVYAGRTYLPGDVSYLIDRS